MFTAEQLLGELDRLSRKELDTPQAAFQKQLRELVNSSPDAVDILTYVTQDWGLGTHPFPTQRFILKLIFGLPLDDRPDDYVTEVLDPQTFKVRHISQFALKYRLDIGDISDVPIEHIDFDTEIIKIKVPIPSMAPGTWVTRRILTFDRFSENIIGSYNEREFLQFLYDDCPEGTHGRCNLNPEMHEKRLGRQMMNVVLRLGRRSGKTNISQWIAAYTAYRLLKHPSPQNFYRLTKQQNIRITLIATAKEQAIDLLRPARAAMHSSSWLKQFIKSDSDQRMSLTTQKALDDGTRNAPGVTLAASPCSARSIRGAGNILALLEEYGCFFTQLVGSNKSDEAIYAALSPSTAEFTHPLTGNPEGMVLIISTPLTKEAHMFKIENEIWEGNMTSSLALHLPSNWVNPLIPTEKLKNEHALDPLMFQQEYEAFYLDEISSALDRPTVESCRETPGPLSLYPRPDEVCYLGLDVGLKGDGTSIVVVAGNYNGECRTLLAENIRVDLPSAALYVRDDDPRILDVEKIAHRVDEIWSEFGCQKGLADAHQSYGIQAYLKTNARQQIEFTEVNQSINDRLARNFLATLYQKRLKLYVEEEEWENKESILRELVRLQRIQTGGNPPKLKLVAPRTNHDDVYSGLSRALWLVQENILGRPISTLTGPAGDVRKKQAESARQRLEVLRRQQTTGRVAPGRQAFRGRRV